MDSPLSSSPVQFHPSPGSHTRGTDWNVGHGGKTHRKSSLLRAWSWTFLMGLFLTVLTSSLGYIVTHFPQLSRHGTLNLWNTLVPPRVDMSVLLPTLAVLATVVVALAFQRPAHRNASDESVEELKRQEALRDTNLGIGLAANVLTLGFAWGQLADLWATAGGISRFWDIICILAAGQAIAIASVATTTRHSERAMLAEAELPNHESRHEQMKDTWLQRWRSSPIGTVSRTAIALAWLVGLAYVFMVPAAGAMIIASIYQASTGTVDTFLLLIGTTVLIGGLVAFLGVKTASSVNRMSRGVVRAFQLALLVFPTAVLAGLAFVQPIHSTFWCTLLSCHLLLVFPISFWRYPKQPILLASMKYAFWHIHILRQSFAGMEYRDRASMVHQLRNLVELRRRELELEETRTAEREQRWLKELTRAFHTESKTSFWERLTSS